MNLDASLFTAILAACVGFAAFWANPQRQVNKLFFSASLHAALWLTCVSRAQTAEINSQLWMRSAAAVGAFLPAHLWVLKETIAAGSRTVGSLGWRVVAWLLPCSLLAILTMSEWFVPTQVDETIPPFGGGYYAYIAGAVLLYGYLCVQSLRQIKQLSGAGRIELQLVLLGGSAAAMSVIILMALRSIFDAAWLMTLRPIVVLLFYSGTVVAITTTRILNARQIVAVSMHKGLLVFSVAALSYVIYVVFSTMMPENAAFITTVGISLFTAGVVDRNLARMLKFYPEAGNARQAAFTAAQRETRVDQLEKSFESVLRGWGQTDHVIILHGHKERLTGKGLELQGDASLLQTIRELQWATPERLLRERSTPGRHEVLGFLLSNSLGVLVFEQGPGHAVVLGVGVGAARRPYTYPQVKELLELASIIESALERAHFAAKVQHTEQLATVGLLGASLAHEIRNPLVSIKTFVQLLPSHHQDEAFRNKFFRLIGDEVTRIDQLTQQLLDLSSPRAYSAQSIALHAVLQESLELVAAKAAHKRVQLITEFLASPDSVYTDESAAKQVMLNLCFNAIQAVEDIEEGERWVRIGTRNTVKGVEMAIQDSGPGIDPEIRPKLFQPFQTTKSSGFGLGLAICSDILANLDATISVDPPVHGCGATFRVTFPCQPLLS